MILCGGLGRRSLLTGAATTLCVPAHAATRKPLIELSRQPPNYDSPLEAFAGPITPNDRFFVRTHESDPAADPNQPTQLTIDGDAAARPATLTLDDLRRLPQQEVVAVCQCLGDRRAAGAMGCAVWRGPRLRDVLAAAGPLPDAVEIIFSGGSMTDYVRSLPIARALHDDTLVALAMNDAPLPPLHGQPARLVVPGLSGDSWVKRLGRIELRRSGQAATRVRELAVNALATSHTDGDRVRGSGFTLAGLAWDSGSGIARVEFSINGGITWGRAMLGPEEGPHAFRPWSTQLSASPGRLRPMLRAVSRAGVMQAAGAPVDNPIQTLDLVAL